MRRTTTLTAAGLLGLALLSPTGTTAATSAIAAGETCRGEAATIVGNGPTLTGTEGRDVVVTNGATDVRTLGGDDVICVARGLQYVQPDVDSGAGNDVVDATNAPGTVSVELGEGSDRFEGGDKDAWVWAGNEPSVGTTVDREKDVIIGRGPLVVGSGMSGQPNPDVIELGAGDDVVHYGGVMAAGGSLEAGGGVDTFRPWFEPAGAAVIDNVAGRLTVDEQVMATWTGLETFYTGTSTSLRFLGTSADETIMNGIGPVHATFGAGTDLFFTREAPPAGSAVDGGTGRDNLYIVSENGLLDLDLRSGKLTADADAPYTIGVSDFEDASLFARRVVLAGTGGRNHFGYTACRATFRGRGGADTAVHDYEGWFETIFCPRFAKAQLNGGGGSDDLQGWRGKDVLRGGKGRDLLDGGEGDDRLSGNRGRDVLNGDEGNDAVRGGSGNDRLFGGKGRDELKGQAGKDVLIGRKGRDRADGGEGRRDRCRAERERRCERH